MDFKVLLEKQKQLRVHTGNINAWSELKKRSFQNGSEELAECLKLQLKKWSPSEEQKKKWESSNNEKMGELCLCQSEFCMPTNIMSSQDRADLRITLKVFLSAFCSEQIRECLKGVCDELRSDSVERLIVSFPDFEADDSDDPLSDEEEAAKLIDLVKPVWLTMEELVNTGLDGLKVVSIGVADFDLHELKALYDWAPSVKPSIDHFNIQSCCTVPPELQAFAKQQEILLITHNDPKPFITETRFSDICCKELGVKDQECCGGWGVGWVGRYAVMVMSRSVLIGKGYVVEFGKRGCKGVGELANGN